MQDIQQTNLDIYGSEPIPWSRALDQLQDDSSRRTTWLATAGPDGHPHVAGVGALWLDGKFYFTSGAGTKKSRDLTANPNCEVSVALPDLDLVVDGIATLVTDEATLQRVAERYAAQGWPAEVDDGALTAPYSAPSAGPPPWYLYVVEPKTAFGVATEEPYGATRWRFMS
jgi:general stress protein 26